MFWSWVLGFESLLPSNRASSEEVLRSVGRMCNRASSEEVLRSVGRMCKRERSFLIGQAVYEEHMKNYKIVVYVPEDHADKLREAMGNAGAGKIGNYTFCTFTSKGVGRFKPENGASPTIGEVGRLESVEEERIETVCQEESLKEVLRAIKEAHPYEESAADVYSIEVIK